MITSFALIFLVGLSMAAISKKLRLPRIIGMLLTGVVLGPFVLNMLSDTVLSISPELRKIALIRTPLNKKERLFCVFAYLPKATVQAAIGSVPLALGLACGNAVLSLAVVSIIITAPLGAFLMDISYKRLLRCENEEKAA